MPFFEDDGRQITAPVGHIPGVRAPGDELPAPDFWSETVPAAFRENETVFSFNAIEPGAYDRRNPLFPELVDPDFDPASEIEGYEDHARRFAFADDPAQVSALKRQIDREREDRRTVNRAGPAGVVASIAAGILDPINLVPVGGSAYRSYRTGRVMLDGGVAGMRAGLLGSTAAEALLWSSQEERTWGEMALNVGAGTFLGGILGAGGAKIRQSVDEYRIGRLHDQARVPDAEGNLGGDGQVMLAFNRLEDNLKTIKLDEGRGAIKADGTADIETDFGMVKVVWKHGAESPKAKGKNAGWNAVTRDDVTAFPEIVRRHEALPDTGRSGAPKWRWVAERPGADGTPRNVVYSVTRFTEGDGADRVVTIHVTGRGGDISPKRAGGLGNAIRGMFGQDAKTRPASASPAMDHGTDGIPPEGSLIPFPGGRTPDAPGNRIADDAANVTPRTLEGDVERDLYLPADDEPDLLEPGGVPEPEIEGPGNTGGSVGAAAARSNTIDEEGLKSALGVEKAVQFQDPLLRVLSGPSITARRALQALAEVPVYIKKNIRGDASPIAVETRIKMHQPRLYRATKAMDDAFARYRLGREKRVGDIARIGAADLAGSANRQGKLNYLQFKEQVSAAMRRGDQHDIREVAQSAAAWRREVFEPLKDLAIEADLLPEDVTVDTAVSYLNRLYDVDKIKSNRTEFKRRITRWLVSEAELAGRRAADDEATLADLDQVLRFERAEVRRVKSAQARAEREAGRARAKAEGKLTEAQAATRTRETDVRQLERRADDLAVDAIPADDDIKGLLSDLKRGAPKQQPQSLSAFLRAKGGLREDGGELANMGVDGKATPGLRNDKSGLALDDATHAAWEAGYMPEFAERPDINDFLALLRDDVNGRPIYAEQDYELAAYADELVEMRGTLEERGVDVGGLTPERLAETLETGAAPATRDSTPISRLRARNAESAAKRAMKRLSLQDARAVKAEADLDDAIRGMMEARAGRTAAREAVEASEQRIKEMARLRGEVRKRRAADQYRAGFDELELEDVARQIIDRILGSPDGRLPYDLDAQAIRASSRGGRPDTSGPLKGRSFKMPDVMLEDFLENDIERLGHVYTRSMASDVELVRAFGTVGMDSQLGDVRAEFDRMIDNAKTAAERKRLEKAKSKADGDLAAVRDRLRGTYALPADPDSVMVRTGRVLRSLNYLRLLGGMTLSAIPDVGRSVMVHGYGRVFRDGLLPLVRNGRAFRAASAEEVRLAGTALDMVLDSRTMAIADVMDDFGRHTKFERGLKSAVDRFGVVSLMAPWNAAMKQFAGVVTMSRILDASARVRAGRATAKEIENLAFSGIDRTMARRIAQEFTAHGVTENGARMANTIHWRDKDAVEAFRAAVVKDVDRIIVTPGQDKPLWMSTQLGALVGQFKSFIIASTQRTLISGLQQRDLAALNGSALMLGLGMMTYAIKETAAGRDLSDDPEKWLVEGIDRSGLTGWLFEANNILEKATRGGFGVNAMIGAGPMSRYASRNITGSLLGPSLGVVEDAVTVSGSLSTGELTRSDVRAFRRLLPYQNLFYMRRTLDAAEQGLADELGVRE